MKKVKLSHTPLEVSKFIFGTASLFNVGEQSKRIRLIEAAVDAGFTHFDTAPYYGFGMAERDMAILAKAHPNVTVTTKVGIYSPGGENQPRASIFLRKALGRFVRPLSNPTLSFDLSRAKAALDASLKRLGRDTIDIYMLHEPTVDIVKTDEWNRWLEDMVTSGKVKSYGLALTEDRLRPFLAKADPLCNLVQVLDSLERREADVLTQHAKPFQITYGYVSAARQNGNTASVSDILQHALRRNPDGAIIVSTKQEARLKQYSDILEALNDQ